MIRLFDVHEQGNFEKGRNILRLRSSPEDAAAVLKISEQELQSKLEKIRLKLFAARKKRIRPLQDDKILIDWNGLMIAALCRAAQALQEPQYAAAAKRAADFILEKMRTPGGRLLHRFRVEAGIQANLDDYVFLVWGLIDLYETVFEAGYLQAALQQNQVMMQHFWDGEKGGLFFSPDDAEGLLLRQKEFYDGAVPSGNAAAMLNLLRLSRLTGDPGLEEMARGLARALSGIARSQPRGHSMLLCALDFALGPSFEIALVGSLEEEGMLRMLEAIRSRFLPNKVVVVASDAKIAKIAPFTESLVQLKGKATAYVCSAHRCLMPTTDPEKMIDLLEENG